MVGGGLTTGQLRRLRELMNNPNEHPRVRNKLRFVEDILIGPQKRQEETDRRWLEMDAYNDGLAEDQRPKTMGEHRDLLTKFGFATSKPMTPSAEKIPGHFGAFMEGWGSNGLTLMESYEMQRRRAAQPRCDLCKMDGATLRCKRCGEWYCSKVCETTGWPSHEYVCNEVAQQRPYSKVLKL